MAAIAHTGVPVREYQSPAIASSLTPTTARSRPTSPMSFARMGFTSRALPVRRPWIVV